MDLSTQVSRNIILRKLLPDRRPILVAVSGGVDSMVLLDLLTKLGKKGQWLPFVAHLNHCLRGSESDGDQLLVKNTAHRLGLEFVTEKADVRAFARQKKISIEMAARQARHEFLARSAKKLGIKTVALAHHADDQVELFFLRLFRGGGVASLAGIHWRNRSPVDPALWLVRPLLNVRKCTMDHYAKVEAIQYREDKTNRSRGIPRNRIRNQLLPRLRKNYQPKLDEIVARAMEILRDENECLETLTERALGKIWKKEKGKAGVSFPILPIAIQRRCTLNQLDRLGIKPNFERIEFLRLHPGKSLNIESGARAESGNCAIKLGSNGAVQMISQQATDFELAEKTLSLKRAGGVKTFGGVELGWKFKSRMGTGLPPRRANEEWFDAEAVGSQVVLRFWRRGDRFQPIGMKFEQKLQDLFTNQKIAPDLKRQLVVAEAENGRIFWIEGQRISERFKLTEGTKSVLRWQWRRI